MKAVGYCRVSSQEQIEGTSLRVQEQQIRTYATLKGVELLSVFIDAGISGGIPIAQRPEGGKLVETLHAGDLSAVIIVKLDRAFRNTVDCLQTIEAWEKQGIALHIVDLGGSSVDTNSPTGRFMLTILAAAGEMERGMIRERCNSGRRACKAQGRRIGEVPFGWSLDDDGKTLVENPEEQEGLSLIFTLRDKGWSLRRIARELNRRGLKAKRGGFWSFGQIQSVLRRAA